MIRVSMDCDDRFCRRCNARRAKRIGRRYASRIARFKNPKLLTLTTMRRGLCQHSVQKLRQDFAKLRRSKVWRASKGLYAIEVGHTDGIGQVNLHIHAIIDGDFMHQAMIAREWRRITKDSYIVDIRRCWSHHGALHYLREYVTKLPEDMPKWFQDRFNETFHGTRLIQPFGDFNTLPDDGQYVPVCTTCGAQRSFVCVDYDSSLDGFSPSRDSSGLA